MITRPGPAAAESPRPSCADAQPDAVAAQRMVRICARPVEILSERTEYSQTFANPDGSRTLEETIDPVRVRRGKSWVPVDTGLKASAGGIAPRATVLPMAFSGGGAGPMARLTHGGRELAISWPGRLPVPVVHGDTAVYRDVLPGADLRVTANALGFSHVLVVRTRQAAADPKVASLTFGLSTKGVRVGVTEGGGLSARDGKGETVFSAPAPVMWDSSTPGAEPGARRGPGSAPESAKDAPGTRKGSGIGAGPTAKAGPRAPASSSAKRAGTAVGVPDGARRAVMPVRVDGDTLTITPDRRLLADPAVKLPIYIDPAWTGSISGNAWTSVWSKHKSSSFWKNSTALLQGKTYGSAGSGRTEDCKGCADHIIRSLFRMDTAAVRGKQILDAKFRIEQKWSWTCNPKSNAKLWLTGSISSGTTWNKQPTWYSSPAPVQTAANRKVGSAHGCGGPATIEFNATSMVAYAAARNWTAMTVGLRAVSESTLKQWKRFNHASPKLAITYNTDPSVPGSRLSDGKPCVTGSNRPYTLTAAPILAVKHADPDTAQQSLTTYFYWWRLGGTRSETDKISQASGNPSTVSKAIPAGKLVDGGTYVWQARTYDGLRYSGWSATCEFTVDLTAPSTPAAVASTDYPPDSPTTTPHGGVGIEGEFTLSPPTAGANDMAGYAWTLDGGVQPSAATQVPTSGVQAATIRYTPVRDGVNTLRVWTKDKAGRYSAAPYTYMFAVRAGSGPAADWRFDEASGNAMDATGHGNGLTLNGSATRTAGRSNVGSALALNGTTGYAGTAGQVMTPHPDTTEPIPVVSTSSISFTAWVRLTATGGAVRSVVSYDGTNVHALRLGYDGATNKWVFRAVATDAVGASGVTIVSTSTAAAGRWTHLAGVYDVATRQIRLYVNGAQEATQTLATTAVPHAATNTLNVGRSRYNAGWVDFWSGAIDDVRVYSYSVPASALALLAAPLPPTVSFPDGDTVSAGQPINVRISAGGDGNVTSYRYSVGDAQLDSTATPTAAGGDVTLAIPTTASGRFTVYAAAVTPAGLRSTVSAAQFTAAGAARLSGSTFDAETGEPVAGALVSLEPGGRSATTGTDGLFTLADLAAGSYLVTASEGGPCGRTIQVQVEVSGDTWVDLPMARVTDELGHTCVEQALAFAPADQTVLALAGDDAVARVELPFAFPFYGASYRSVWVDTNGMVSFDDPGGSHPYPGGRLPTAADPSNLVAPFWDDLVVDSSASVRTAVTGTGAEQRLTVEWRNVHRKASTAQRLSFEVVLAADGTVTTNYAGLDSDAERGAHAAVGIESPAGEDGLTYSAGAPVLAGGRAVVFDHPGEGRPIDVFDLSGTLTDAAGAPVAGVPVRLDPSGLSGMTGADGSWRFEDLVADSYAVSASTGGRCGQVIREQVELSGDASLGLRLGPDYGELGYGCAAGAAGFVSASTVLALTGDDAASRVSLPFAVSFHGRSYSTAWVHTNGLVSFGDVAAADKAWENAALPSGAAPNAVVAPFWDDLNVDASASVRTLTQGTAPNRSYVVEWRNVLLQGTTERVTFEVVFGEDKRITFQYGALSSAVQRGAGATVGLENGSGTVAALYSFGEAVLTGNSAITYTPGPVGAISGTLTTAITGQAVAGKTVTLSPGGLTATTGADGSYRFTGVPVGEYAVQAATGDAKCAGQYAREIVNVRPVTSDVDLSLMTAGDEGGYTCATGAQTFVAGDVVEDWSGDETVWQKNPPFPVKLYGNAYTSAWISANGVVTFKDPQYTGWIQSMVSPIPSEPANGLPNAAVYVHWDDWVVDPQADIATRLTGTAPNRRWVVEWRNVVLFDDPNGRATFEVIFDEGGGITFAYAGIDAANPVERGSGAVVGIENGTGTIAFQYLYKEALLASGQGLRFTPTPPGVGSVTGTVTCAGNPVAGATVTTRGRSATTAADGTYQIADVPAGTHAVVATRTGGACGGSQVAHVTVGTNTAEVADFPAPATPAGAGYTVAEQAVAYVAAGTVLPVTGDDAYRQVTLPFPIRLYGQTYSTGWVDSNGLVSFVDPGEPSPDALPIPSPDGPEEPNAAVYPFWHDWVVDADASVRTATTGTAPNRKYVVEWRNVRSYEDAETRATFEVIFDEAGGWSFAYTDLDGTFLELGGGATIGIENADGTIALQYTYRQPVLRPGYGLRFTPPIG